MAEDNPSYILSEDSKRMVGKVAQRNNILAARIVAETVRTTLGPKGMDKMLVDASGEIVVTNDGVTILEEMQIEHPAAKMVVEVARTQENEVGDGTTTAVVFAGELLKNAEELLNKGIHPTIITKGYRLASAEAFKILEAIGENVSDDASLKNIASTAMTGKGAEVAKDNLSNLVVESVKRVKEQDGNINLENIKLEKKTGGSLDASELVQGIILDKERVHSGMPRVVHDAKIALLDLPLEIKNTEIDAKIQITDPSKVQEFLDLEENMLKDMVERIYSSGATVVVCQKGIDDLVQHFLAKKSIFAVRRVKKSDMDKLAKASSGKVISNLKDLAVNDLGNASLVEEKKIGDEEMTFITGCSDAKSVTILVRGGTEHVVDEAERAVKDALGDVAAVLRDGRAVGGAGACEISLSKGLHAYANTLTGRERLAVEAFSDAIEIIPETLAENAGLDPIDVISSLKVSEFKWAGLNVFTGAVMDSWAAGVIEPLKIKIQAIKSATEVTEMILRIDDVLAAGRVKENFNPEMR
jgi:archaeal chaperonin